ncbi:hypothetical protein A6I77_24505 [Achromobacter xylosoxidans]|nr:hypothetical protein A6I77_24505 [Achromobacter xylosoxidans]
MTTPTEAANAAEHDPMSDAYVNAIIQRHGYDSPESVIAQLHQWIGLHGGKDTVTLLMYEAHKALSKLRAPVAGKAVALELRGVPETIKEGDGFWRSCTGCHELNEGRDTGPYSAVLGCHLGQGCGECGGIGAIWDSTDYQTVADDMARDMGQSVSVAPLASAPEVAEAQPVAYLTRDEEGSPCMLFFDVVEARGYCAIGEEPEPLFLHAAPQACALNAEYTRGRVDGFDAGHGAALEKAAAALEDHRKAGRAWVPGSLWDTLSREAAARIRALKQPRAPNPGRGALTNDVALPPLPAELRDTEIHSREYARAAVLFDRLKRARGGENHV